MKIMQYIIHYILYNICIFLMQFVLVMNLQFTEDGQTVLFICPFRKKTDPIQWERHAVTYSEDENINPRLDDVIRTRLNVVRNSSYGQFNLQMRNVSKQDEGKYTCLTKIDGIGVQNNVYLFFVEKQMWTTDGMIKTSQTSTNHWTTDELINDSETTIDLADKHDGSDASSHNNIAVYIICIVCTIIVTTMLNICFRYLPHKEMCQIHGNGRGQNIANSSNQNNSRVLEGDHLGQINAYDEIDETAMTAITIGGIDDRRETSSNEASSSNEEDISGSGYLHPYQSIIGYVDVHRYAKCIYISNIKKSSNSLPASLKGLSNIPSQHFTKERDQKISILQIDQRRKLQLDNNVNQLRSCKQKGRWSL